MHDVKDRAFIRHAKGLFNTELLSALRERFVLQQEKQNQFDVSPREVDALGRGESTDKLRMQAVWYDVWKQPVANQDFFAYLSPYRYVSYPVQVRHVRQRTHHVPWHQDIGYMRLLGERGPKQVMTCFIPLEPEPAKCTTIQFARDPAAQQSIAYPHYPLDGFGAGIEGDFNDVFHFDLNLGDALIFGDHVLHRTFLPENCQVERRSLEFRLLMSEHIMPSRDYFDIQLKKFVQVSATMEINLSPIEQDTSPLRESFF